MTTPDEWGVTPEEAADLLNRQVCPICGVGPWKSPLNHVARKHGIHRNHMRDVCGLSVKDKVTDERVRGAWIEHGRTMADVLRSNAGRTKGKPQSKPNRRTRADERRRQDNALLRWAAENPDEAARVRAGFKDRMNTEEAKAAWRGAMERVRAEREYTDEERERFRARMADPEVVERRRTSLAASRTEWCSVEGCPRPHVAKGMCGLHWRRAKKTGGAGTLAPMSLSEAARKPRPTRRALNDEQMSAVRDLYAAGQLSQREIASRFGTTQSVVSRVVKGEYR